MLRKIKPRSALIAGGVLAVIAAPTALGAGEGQPVDGGARNPANDARQNYTKETEIIANVGTYGTRQSNKSDNGGGAVYGCRSKEGGTAKKNEPCLRATNLANGFAFEFNSSSGLVGGLITVGKGGDGVKPFTTNATGVADGLNADRVDGRDGADLLGKTDKAADADKIDGVDGSEFARAGDLLFARVASNGTTVSASRPGGVTSESVDANTARVSFGKNISNCSFTATVNSSTPAATSATLASGRVSAVDVSTDGGALQPFNLQVIC